MIQKDYFLRMIEEAAYFVSRLMGLREESRYGEVEKLLDQAYGGWFPFDRAVIMQTDPEELPEFLERSAQLAPEQFSVLADLLREESETWFAQGQWERGQHLLRCALSILRHLNAKDPDLFSFPRQEKIQSMADRLQGLENED